MRLDIVIPAHNEQARIGRTLTAYRRACQGSGFRFLVAMDACTDETVDVVAEHAGSDERVVALEYPKLGKGGVIAEAFAESDAELVGFVDADCATPPRELLRLAEATAAGADGAIASRRHPAAVLPVRRHLARRVTSAGFAFGVRALMGLPFRDTQCGAKVLRREVVSDVLPRLAARDLLFDVDLLTAARDAGHNVVEVPTVWIDREGSRVDPVRDSRRMATSLARLWLRQRRAITAPPRSPDVALITPYPRPGERHGGRSGVAGYSAQLAHALTAAGARVTVVAPREPGEPAVEQDGPVRIERSFERGGAGALPAAARAARATGAPVVHLQHELFLFGGPSALPGLAAGLADLRRDRRRTVVTMHHVVDPRSVDRSFTRLHRVAVPPMLARTGLAAMQRTIAGLASRVLVHEPTFARVVPGAEVVPHGIEPLAAAGRTAAERSAARAALGLPGERLCVLCFGFLAPYKGLETALEAAALTPEIELVVAGGEHPRLAASGDGYAESLHASAPANVRFTGWVDDADVSRWFVAADVAMLLYPRPHGTSGPLAIALAHRTPVLLSNALAACADAPAGLAVTPDAMTIAERLRGLDADRGALAGLGALTEQLAAGRDWPAVAARHLALYEGASR